MLSQIIYLNKNVFNFRYYYYYYYYYIDCCHKNMSFSLNILTKMK